MLCWAGLTIQEQQEHGWWEGWNKANLKKWDFAFSSAVFFIFFWFAPILHLYTWLAGTELRAWCARSPYRDNLFGPYRAAVYSSCQVFCAAAGVPAAAVADETGEFASATSRARVKRPSAPSFARAARKESSPDKKPKKKRKKEKEKERQQQTKNMGQASENNGRDEIRSKRAVRSLPSSGCLITINHATCALRRIIYLQQAMAIHGARFFSDLILFFFLRPIIMWSRKSPRLLFITGGHLLSRSCFSLSSFPCRSLGEMMNHLHELAAAVRGNHVNCC